MGERYLPPSSFLQDVLNENVPFGERDIGDINLQRLIGMTGDTDTANRDWATLLLAQLEMDRSDVREALITAASDADVNVRGEAILGIAQLDRTTALPLLARELKGDIISKPLMEAAAIVADVSLVPDLEAFSNPSDDAWMDSLVDQAITACRSKSL